ncbi:hypothetical protein V8J82_11545 [Gymnodinialimonas sp. 2305UL16-5]|uniref:hypothetical protein n=1 Tax=Gymnodinialimonas mytili TaxID=3126503 RepID=UPI00309D647F
MLVQEGQEKSFWHVALHRLGQILDEAFDQTHRLDKFHRADQPATDAWMPIPWVRAVAVAVGVRNLMVC